MIQQAITRVRIAVAGRSVEAILKGFAKQQAALRRLGQQLLNDAQRKKQQAAELEKQANAAVEEAARAARAAAKIETFLH